MKQLLIIVILVVGGFFAYQQFFGNDIVDEITDRMMADMSGVPRKTVKSCVSIELSGMSAQEKEKLKQSLDGNSETQSYSSMDEMMSELEKSMNTFNSVMECIMTEMTSG